MLVQSNTLFAKVELLPDGSIIRYRKRGTKYMALAEGCISRGYKSIKEMEGYDWKLLPPDLETIGVGDMVKVNSFNIQRRIMSATGYGAYRLYTLSGAGEFLLATSSPETAYELKMNGYTPLPWEEEPNRTVDQILEELSDGDKDILKSKLK